MESAKYSILVVDDEELMRYLVVSYLSKLGHSCLTAVDGVDALDKIKKNKIDAVITDIRLPNMDGMTLTQEISRQYPGLPIMIMTAFDEEYSEGTVISAGAREFLRKPFTLDEFAVRLNKMINDSETIKRMGKEKKADEDLQDLMKELERILKNS
ncbi:MAG TPA: response regulator [Thermodesulfobacteriota bacterium]|nr:response regulator [Thermodesulfobacteriota bacterium]